MNECQLLLKDGQICGKQAPKGKFLPAFAFRNINKKKNQRWEEIEVCQDHSDEIETEIRKAAKDYEQELKDLNKEINRFSTQKYDPNNLMHKMEEKKANLEKILEKIYFGTCPGCGELIPEGEMIYPVNLLSSKGKNRHLSHFHKLCQIAFKQKFGEAKKIQVELFKPEKTARERF